MLLRTTVYLFNNPFSTKSQLSSLHLTWFHTLNNCNFISVTSTIPQNTQLIYTEVNKHSHFKYTLQSFNFLLQQPQEPTIHILTIPHYFLSSPFSLTHRVFNDASTMIMPGIIIIFETPRRNPYSVN